MDEQANKYPVEVCCPMCEEVVVLVWQPIPGDTLLRKIIDLLDTPMRGDSKINVCPVCQKNIEPRDSGWGFPPRFGWIRLIKQAMERDAYYFDKEFARRKQKEAIERLNATQTIND